MTKKDKPKQDNWEEMYEEFWKNAENYDVMWEHRRGGINGDSLREFIRTEIKKAENQKL